MVHLGGTVVRVQACRQRPAAGKLTNRVQRRCHRREAVFSCSVHRGDRGNNSVAAPRDEKLRGVECRDGHEVRGLGIHGATIEVRLKRTRRRCSGWTSGYHRLNIDACTGKTFDNDGYGRTGSVQTNHPSTPLSPHRSRSGIHKYKTIFFIVEDARCRVASRSTRSCGEDYSTHTPSCTFESVPGGQLTHEVWQQALSPAALFFPTTTTITHLLIPIRINK